MAQDMDFDGKRAPVFDNLAGRARIEASARAVTRMKALATPPNSTGPEIPVAPARGAYFVFHPTEMVPGSTERVRRIGYRGRSTLRIADAFDVMAARAKANKAAAPLSHGQISAGRDYAALVARLSAVGYRCSSLETVSRGSGGAGTYSDAVLADSQRLEGLRRRIGAGTALMPQRCASGTSRRMVSDLALVEKVCVKEMSLSQVLRYYGWSVKSKHLATLREALRSSLDRMQGY